MAEGTFQSRVENDALDLSRRSSELDGCRGRRFRRRFEVRTCGEVKGSCDEVSREGLDAVVVAADASVVPLSGAGDVVLDGCERVLQAEEVLVGFQVRVRLGDGEEAFERSSELVLSRRSVRGCADISGIDRVTRSYPVG